MMLGKRKQTTAVEKGTLKKYKEKRSQLDQGIIQR